MTTVSPLPTPPSRNDPANFATRADQFLAALPTFVTELNTVASEINAVASDVNASKTAALVSEQNAASYATVAQAAAATLGATRWVSGTNYAEGAVVWSPVTGRPYRRKAPGGISTVDPSSDSNGWYDVLALLVNPLVIIDTNTTAQAGIRYAVKTNNIEITLPNSPVIGSVVGFVLLPGITGLTINPQSEKIRGATGPMIVDMKNASADLIYTGSTYGWV